MREPHTFSARTIAWLRQLLNAKNRGAPSISSLTFQRKLTPIDDVLANIGRDPLPPD